MAENNKITDAASLSELYGSAASSKESVQVKASQDEGTQDMLYEGMATSTDENVDKLVCETLQINLEAMSCDSACGLDKSTPSLSDNDVDNLVRETLLGNAAHLSQTSDQQLKTTLTDKNIDHLVNEALLTDFEELSKDSLVKLDETISKDSTTMLMDGNISDFRSQSLTQNIHEVSEGTIAKSNNTSSQDFKMALTNEYIDGLVDQTLQMNIDEQSEVASLTDVTNKLRQSKPLTDSDLSCIQSLCSQSSDTDPTVLKPSSKPTYNKAVRFHCVKSDTTSTEKSAKVPAPLHDHFKTLGATFENAAATPTHLDTCTCGTTGVSTLNPEDTKFQELFETPAKIFKVSSAELPLSESNESDTPASSLSSVSSHATNDANEHLPANCSVAYTCSETDVEDLSRSKYQGLSGHLMDYYLTMVFPGQPGVTDGSNPEGLGAPIEPVFQIGEELIQKTPGAKVPLADEFDHADRKIILGICAMEKKSRSKPMIAILERLAWFELIETHIFDEKVILNEPVERWPICDVFVSFHSRGFPLDKAIAYVKCRKPIVVNDLDLQFTLQDRRDVHKILEKEGIPQPRYMVVNREVPENGVVDPRTELPLSEGKFFQELEDSVELDGELFHKPFVEKPVSAEDHNVYIYFPTAAGGGSQRLFRKVGSRSSIYSNYTRVRKGGSYIYEDFMPTDGTDVKVYTVGPDYAHAEARKSPALDGKVERDQNGKEVRYPVILSANEKMIARKVTLAFKQTVCGFDLLRANGQSLVCDVNGFSFVKTSSKYYDDCAKVLGTMIMRALAPQLHIPWVLGSAPEDIPVVPTTSGTMMELRCVTAVIRHGDRTPKQKMKMEVKQKRPPGTSTMLFDRFFELFQKYDGYRTGQLKLKQPKQLQEVLDIVRYLLQENQRRPDPQIEEKKAKLEQLKLVLEMYGYFSGINRKVQLKYQPHGRPKRSSSEEEISLTDISSHWLLECEEPDLSRNSSELLLYEFTGINRKIQLRDQPYFEPPVFSSDGNHGNTDKSASSKTKKGEDVPSEPSLLLIVKWGGELTPAGKIQAEQLGKAFRSLYPGGQGEYGAPGLGILRLHSTYRHDLKIYASDEGRVQMTAAAFTKGLLALEGELPPILVQMVKCANTNGLLDSEGETSKYQHVVKDKLKDILNQDREFTELDYVKLAPSFGQSLLKAIRFIRNPFQMCERVHEMVKAITTKVRQLKKDQPADEKRLYHGETWDLLLRRWAKLEKDFKMKSGFFDINKIPDIYDCIKYDLQHNQKVLQYDQSETLYNCSKALADIVIPQEYGITKEEKLHIAQSYGTPLLKKIRSDLAQVLSQDEESEITRLDSRYSKGIATPHRFVRTRLYFTSESHIHSLLTMLRYGGLLDEVSDKQWARAMEYVSNTAELNYMTQIVIMMYEDPNKEYMSEERFHVELHFSPGAYSWDNEAPTGAHVTKSLNDKPDPAKVKNVMPPSKHLHCKNSGPAGITFPLDREATVFGAILEEQEKNIKSPKVGLPKSPDPNVPEWDWGDDLDLQDKASQGSEDKVDDGSVVNVESEVKVNSGQRSKIFRSLQIDERSKVKFYSEAGERSYSSLPKLTDIVDQECDKNVDKELMDQSEQSRSATQPISIARERPAIRVSDADESRSQSFEEKRSQSFEEKSQDVEDIRPRLLSLPPSPEKMFQYYNRKNNQRCSSMLEVPSSFPMVERHYLTVQLPLVDPKQKHRHSFANIFTIPGLIGTEEGFRGFLSTRVLLGSTSAPNLACLNNDDTLAKLYVPSIQPLETLYNSLTLRKLDRFLDRITNVKFMTPSSSPPSNMLSPSQGGSPQASGLELTMPYSAAYSLPTSANSSPISSSPVTTDDVLMKLRVFMMEKQFASDTSNYKKIQKEKHSLSYTGHNNPLSHGLTKDKTLKKDFGLGPFRGRQGQIHKKIEALLHKAEKTLNKKYCDLCNKLHMHRHRHMMKKFSGKDLKEENEEELKAEKEEQTGSLANTDNGGSTVAFKDEAVETVEKLVEREVNTMNQVQTPEQHLIPVLVEEDMPGRIQGVECCDQCGMTEAESQSGYRDYKRSKSADFFDSLGKRQHDSTRSSESISSQDSSRQSTLERQTESRKTYEGDEKQEGQLRSEGPFIAANEVQQEIDETKQSNSGTVLLN